MTATEVPFGRALFESLGRLRGGEILTRRMKYADIQELKTANREQTLTLFAGSSYEVLQRIKKDSPEDLANFLVSQADEADARARRLLVFAAVFLAALAALACAAPLGNDRVPVDAPIHDLAVVGAPSRTAGLVIALRYGLSDSCHAPGEPIVERGVERILVRAQSLRLSDPGIGCRQIYQITADTLVVEPPFPTSVTLEPLNPVDDAAAVTVTFP